MWKECRKRGRTSEKTSSRRRGEMGIVSNGYPDRQALEIGVIYEEMERREDPSVTKV